MEIERKFLVKQLPFSPEDYPCLFIEQGYLNTEPVVRVRRQDDTYYLTYKSSGLLSREEYNLPLNKEAYDHLIQKADGYIITKRRYLIPLEDDLKIELDIFEGTYKGLILAEVEFTSEEQALNFVPPNWFDRDVTFSGEYQNSTLSKSLVPIEP